MAGYPNGGSSNQRKWAITRYSSTIEQLCMLLWTFYRRWHEISSDLTALSRPCNGYWRREENVNIDRHHPTWPPSNASRSNSFPGTFWGPGKAHSRLINSYYLRSFSRYIKRVKLGACKLRFGDEINSMDLESDFWMLRAFLVNIISEL